MLIIVFIILGLAFGSFINALVWRIHEQSQAKNPNKQLSVINGRSMCPYCRHTLGVKDLIPVLSWLSLKGKCRYCQKPISWQYPVVELVTAGLFVVSYLMWPLELDARGITALAFWLVLLVGLIALAIYDLRWMLLPNRIVIPLIVIAISAVLFDALLFDGGWSSLQQALWGALFGGGLFYLLFQASQGKWIGGGDVKLGFLLGIIVGGPWEALLLIFIAAVLGSVVGVVLVITKNLKLSQRMPFGPYLILAAIIVQLFGAELVKWYQDLLLL